MDSATPLSEESFFSLKKTADTVPCHVSWFRIGKGIDTELIVHTPMLNTHKELFPIRVRIRLFNNNVEYVDHITDEIPFPHIRKFSFKKILGNQDIEIENGYAEITPFPVKAEALSLAFFGELWAQVYDESGVYDVTFPPLNFKGVSARMFENRTLYYPGYTCDTQFSTNLVILNQYTKPIDVKIKLWDSENKKSHEILKNISPKTSVTLTPEEVLTNPEDFFEKKPGFAIVSAAYKINAFVQTVCKKTGYISGMDHLGYMRLFGLGEIKTLHDPKEKQLLRTEDPLLCFCTSMTQNDFKAMKVRGMSCEQICSETESGRICGGCTAELEEIYDKI